MKSCALTLISASMVALATSLTLERKNRQALNRGRERDTHYQLHTTFIHILHMITPGNCLVAIVTALSKILKTKEANKCERKQTNNTITSKHTTSLAT